MIHPDTTLIFLNDKIGYGVIATRDLPAGTIIWVRDPLDIVIPPEEWRALAPEIRAQAENHTFRLPSGEYFLCWDKARYLNHSFMPNTGPTPFGFEVALREINCGEELRGDYGMLFIEEPFAPLPEAGSTRTIVNPDDAPLLCAHYDALLAPLWPLIPYLPQALSGIIPPLIWEHLIKIATRKELPPRLAELYGNG